MGITDFTYHRPATLAEACELGRRYGEEARYLAGGTELLVDLKTKRRPAHHLVSLRDVPQLDDIHLDENDLHIGSLAKLTDVARSPIVQSSFPVLAEGIRLLGSTHIRNQATIGGNFCGAVPCADTPPMCIAGGARIRIVGVGSVRDVAAEDFFRSPRETVLVPGEILTEILIPIQPDTCGASYQRFSLRHGSALSVAAVAARIVLVGGRIIDARVVLGAVAPVPLFARECSRSLVQGGAPKEELFAQAAEVAAKEAQPITDLRGTKEFRRDLVEVLTVRALRQATERAGGTVS